MELDKLARRPKLSQPFSAARRSHTTHHVEIGSTAAFDTRGPPRPLTRLLADHRRDQQQDAIGMHRPFVLLSLKCPAFSWSFALVLVLVLTAYTTHSCCWQVLADICFTRLPLRWHLRFRFCLVPVRLSLLFDEAFVLNLRFVLLGAPVRLRDKCFVFIGLLWLLSTCTPSSPASDDAVRGD